MDRRTFLRVVGLTSIVPIKPKKQRESPFYEYLISDEAKQIDIALTSPTGRIKSHKEVVLEYIVRLFNDNWDPETETFQFLGLFREFVVMHLELWGDGGRGNFYADIYEEPSHDMPTLPGFCIRNGNYNHPKREWPNLNKNPHIKHCFDTQKIALKLGHNKPYFITEKLKHDKTLNPNLSS